MREHLELRLRQPGERGRAWEAGSVAGSAPCGLGAAGKCRLVCWKAAPAASRQALPGGKCVCGLGKHSRGNGEGAG